MLCEFLSLGHPSMMKISFRKVTNIKNESVIYLSEMSLNHSSSNLIKNAYQESTFGSVIQIDGRKHKSHFLKSNFKWCGFYKFSSSYFVWVVITSYCFSCSFIFLLWHKWFSGANLIWCGSIGLVHLWFVSSLS